MAATSRHSSGAGAARANLAMSQRCKKLRSRPCWEGDSCGERRMVSRNSTVVWCDAGKRKRFSR